MINLLLCQPQLNIGVCLAVALIFRPGSCQYCICQYSPHLYKVTAIITSTKEVLFLVEHARKCYLQTQQLKRFVGVYSGVMLTIH